MEVCTGLDINGRQDFSFSDYAFNPDGSRLAMSMGMMLLYEPEMLDPYHVWMRSTIDSILVTDRNLAIWRLPEMPSITAMNRSSYRHHITTWTAILAVLMSLLAPGISHAVFKAGGSPHGSDTGQFERTLAESHHAHQAHTAGQANKHLGKVTLHLQHCAYCVVHAGSFGLMPSAAIGWNLPALAQRAPDKHVVLSLPTPVWAMPQSRAPPAA